MVPMIGSVVTTLVVDFGGAKTWSAVASTSNEQTITVRGLKTTDVVFVTGKPTLQAGLTVGTARVSAADTLAITFITSGATVTPTANETYKLLVMRLENTLTDAVA